METVKKITKRKKKLPLKSECLYIDIETVPGPLELK